MDITICLYERGWDISLAVVAVLLPGPFKMPEQGSVQLSTSHHISLNCESVASFISLHNCCHASSCWPFISQSALLPSCILRLRLSHFNCLTLKGLSLTLFLIPPRTYAAHSFSQNDCANVTYYNCTQPQPTTLHRGKVVTFSNNRSLAPAQQIHAVHMFFSIHFHWALCNNNSNVITAMPNGSDLRLSFYYSPVILWWPLLKGVLSYFCELCVLVLWKGKTHALGIIIRIKYNSNPIVFVKYFVNYRCRLTVKCLLTGPSQWCRERKEKKI
jgi:hypothetical protein